VEERKLLFFKTKGSRKLLIHTDYFFLICILFFFEFYILKNVDIHLFAKAKPFITCYEVKYCISSHIKITCLLNSKLQ